MAYTTINKPNLYFDTQLWTGTNASGRTFTGLNFRPDFIWNKCYNSSNYYFNIVDIVRGGTKFLATSIATSEDTASHGQITSFNSDGTTWADGTNATYPRLYYNDGAGSTLGGSQYVSWNWSCGGTGVSNTSGTITSTVSANQTAGCSVGIYTGNGTGGATIGHGLGSVPKWIIVKDRGGSNQWLVYHVSNGATKYMILETTGGVGTASTIWNDTTPTTNLFTVGSSSSVNGSGLNYVFYAFSDIKGFSKFGSYTGNGSTDGTFVYTGFKPAWILMKVSSTTDSWMLMDNMRSPYNQVISQLEPNTANAASDNTARAMDFLSNGFKFRSNNTQNNASGATYIYAAFAENPFVTSGGIPVTAR